MKCENLFFINKQKNPLYTSFTTKFIFMMFNIENLNSYKQSFMILNSYQNGNKNKFHIKHEKKTSNKTVL